MPLHLIAVAAAAAAVVVVVVVVAAVALADLLDWSAAWGLELELMIGLS